MTVNSMYTILRPKKVAIYQNPVNVSGRKSIEEIKAITGADYIINGTLYDMSTYKPTMTFKVDGKLYSEEPFAYVGYAWSGLSAPVLTTDYALYDNFITGANLIIDGQKCPMYYSQEVNGFCGRSAIGMFSDGRMLLYCGDNKLENERCLPEELQNRMYALGVKDAIMLDGRTSTQMLSDKRVVTSERIVQNYICVWEHIKGYRVQVGAFPTRAQAERYKQELADAGYSGFIVEAELP
jgi:Exopolysaccharide biosynthesis protein related to N-acetylglucosamine-1-phosphodiester alpha-N-acetylglucosaminidase